MNVLDIPIHEALAKYLDENSVYIEWDNLEQCYIVYSHDGYDVSKFHEVQDAFEWALKMAKVDYHQEE